jgi:PucR C-terminal helix-turn-helix domain/GGDEF-like domain
VTALVLLFTLRAAEADQRVCTDLLADLLAVDRDGAGADDVALVERGRLLGFRLQAPHVLVVCRTGPVRPRGLLLAVSQAGTGRGLAGVHGGAVVGLVPGGDPGAVARSLARPGPDRNGPGGNGPEGDGPVTVGAVGPVAPLRGLRAAHTEAARVAAALLALGLRGHGGTLADLGFAGLVAGDAPDVDGYLDRVLGPVLAYDGRRGSDLAGTLEVYFGCGTSPRRAAGELHVHPNTVAQRLDRVAGLLGADWQQPDRALEIQLALRLRRLRRG